MRKRNFTFYLDKIIWTVIAFLPLIMFLINALKIEIGTWPTAQDDQYIFVSWSEYEDSMLNGSFAYGTTIYDAYYKLINVFNPSSTMEWQGIANVMAWATIVELLHIAFDVIVFLPRLCHNFFDKLCKNNNE